MMEYRGLRLTLTLILALPARQAPAQELAPIRPPAVPPIVHDPYFSVWSMTDVLTDQPTKHWTGADQPPTGLARVDGATHRLIGPQPRRAEPKQPEKQVA